jgi:nucleotide-binding universal stress UspA family protein
MTDDPDTRPRVLCTTDFSGASESASLHALAIALRLRSRLTLLHTGSESREAVPWERFPDIRGILVGWGVLPPGAPKSAVAAELGIDVDKKAIRDEDPRLGIIDYLRQRPVDLLVMSTDCYAGRNRFAAPSIAESVGFETGTLTLLLPRQGATLINAKDGGSIMRRVLCALPPGYDARSAIAFLGRWLPMMTATNFEVIVLEAAGVTPATGLEVLPSPPRVSWRRVPCSDLGVDTIATLAREHDADLLLMGGSNPRSLRARLRGTEIDNLFDRLRRPVLMIPRI